MKGINKFIFITVFIALTFCCSCQAQENADNDFQIIMNIDDPIMTVNSVEQNIDEQGTAPMIYNGRTIVPVRAVIEAMGGSVEWNRDTQTAVLTYNNDTISLTVDSNTALLNGIENTLDTAPIIINSRTMLPIRFIAESFNFDVNWDENTQTITIKNQNIAETAKAEPEPAADKKVLVAYYSATGSTENAANFIADEAGADIFEITPVDPYTSEDLNYNDDNSRVTREHENEALRTVDLTSTAVADWESYDVVFIGYPIWWGIAAWPVNSFVTDNDFTDKTVIPFCTSASSGLGESGKLLADMTQTGNWLEGKRFSSNASEEDVKEWTRDILQNN